MHWTDVGGVPLPLLLGGHPALDFCNTWAGWGEPPAPGREWLRSYDVLATWCGYAGLVAPETADHLRAAAAAEPDRAAVELVRARDLRTAVHDAALDPGDPESLAVVGEAARRAAAAAELAPGPEVAEWRLPVDPPPLDLPTLVVGRAAAGLLTSSEVRWVSACPGHDCGWLFLDPRGRRRWCSMASCGNRAKVAAHARRRQDG